MHSCFDRRPHKTAFERIARSKHYCAKYKIALAQSNRQNNCILGNAPLAGRLPRIKRKMCLLMSPAKTSTGMLAQDLLKFLHCWQHLPAASKFDHLSHNSSGPWPIVLFLDARSYAAEAGDGGPPVSLLRWRPSAHKLHARKRTIRLASAILLQCWELW